MVSTNLEYPLFLNIRLQPVFRLAIIELQHKSNYISYEVQYVHDSQDNSGYRLLCYHKDGHVDLYEQDHLIKEESVSMDMVEKGLGAYIQTSFSHVVFDIRDELLYISFSFVDQYHQTHTIDIAEGTTRKTRPFDLLAPLGESFKEPTYLPVFFLYDFDFLRKRKSKVRICIDNKKMKIKNFIYPVPKDAQWRYYTRFAKSAQIVEFLSTSQKEIIDVTVADDAYETKYLRYSFLRKENGVALERIDVKTNPAGTSILFTPALPHLATLKNDERIHGTFDIQGAKQAGSIQGCYHIRKKNNRVQFEVTPKDGYKGVANRAFTKMIFQENSVFCKWPKTYHYESIIDLETKKIHSFWNRIT